AGARNRLVVPRLARARMARDPAAGQGRGEPQGGRRHPVSAVRGRGGECRPGHRGPARARGATARHAPRHGQPRGAAQERAVHGHAGAAGRRPAGEPPHGRGAARYARRGAPPSRLGLTLRGALTGDSGVAPSGAVTALLGPSLFAGAGLDSGALRLRLADRRVYVDSLRLAQPGLVTTGSGSLGWTRGASGQLALDFDADSLSAIDSLVTWLAQRDNAARADPDPDPDPRPNRPLVGSARVVATLGGS